MLSEVRDFVALARRVRIWPGDRRVSPESDSLAITFQRLATDARACPSLDAVDAGAAAVEQVDGSGLRDSDYNYFRSDDPVEAPRFLVSDTAALLWERLHDQYGSRSSPTRRAAADQVGVPVRLDTQRVRPDQREETPLARVSRTVAGARTRDEFSPTATWTRSTRSLAAPRRVRTASGDQRVEP